MISPLENIMDSAKNALIFDYDNPNCYLCKLLKFQNSCGVTYFGKCEGSRSSRRKYLFRKVSLIIFETFTIISLFLFQYLAFSQKVYDRLFNKSSKKIIMSFIFNVSGFAIFAEYLILKLYALISGSKIIDTIVSIGIQYLKLFINVITKEFFSGSLKRENKSMIWIYVFILIISFLESIGFSLTFVEFDKTLVWYLSEEKFYFIFYFIEGIFYGATKSSISSLLLLTAFIIRQKLNGMKIFEFILSPYSENSVVFY
jgi:hypothetical protein